jgi:hypothetical protein
MSQAEKLTAPTIEQMDKFITEMKAAKKALEDWKADLPVYYDPFLVPAASSLDDDSDAYAPYPYSERLDYFTSSHLFHSY